MKKDENGEAEGEEDEKQPEVDEKELQQLQEDMMKQIPDLGGN